MHTPITPFTILYISVLVFLVIIWHKGITSSLSRMLLSSFDDSFEEDTQLLPHSWPFAITLLDSRYWAQFPPCSPGKVMHSQRTHPLLLLQGRVCLQSSPELLDQVSIHAWFQGLVLGVRRTHFAFTFKVYHPTSICHKMKF